MSQFIGALIKGTTKPVRFLRITGAKEQRVENSHDAEHVLAENFQTSRFL
ncbi:hypothetical protein [Paraburkholderia sp. BL6669N2]|nr:hypothetical protein [Paraburkholderia sp. BL6669N2]